MVVELSLEMGLMELLVRWWRWWWWWWGRYNDGSEDGGFIGG